MMRCIPPLLASVVGLDTRPRLGIQPGADLLTDSLLDGGPKLQDGSGLDRIRLPLPDCSLRASHFLIYRARTRQGAMLSSSDQPTSGKAVSRQKGARPDNGGRVFLSAGSCQDRHTITNLFFFK